MPQSHHTYFGVRLADHVARVEAERVQTQGRAELDLPPSPVDAGEEPRTTG